MIKIQNLNLNIYFCAFYLFMNLIKQKYFIIMVYTPIQNK